MANAVNSTPAHIVIPFPVDRARPTASPIYRYADDWTRARNVALAARCFGSTPAEATDMVRSTILEGGAEAVAKMLEETSYAIGLLHDAVAELVAADQLISAAADRVLAEAGL